MTRAQIVARAQLYAGESKSITGTDWVSLFDAIYDEIARDCRCLPVTYTANIVDSQRTYMIPTYFLGIRSNGVMTNGSTYTHGVLAGPMSIDVLRRMDRDWKTTEGAPIRWYIAEELVTSGSDTNWAVGLAPVPASNDTSGLIIDGWRSPTAITTDAGVPTIPAGYHDAIAVGIASVVATVDARGGTGSWTSANQLRKQFGVMKKELKAAFGAFGAKVWIRGGEQPGMGSADMAQAAPFHVNIT